ncbi:MAG: helix-turn-helix domain-containing protein [Gammaproteobacteria bacterium]|nr:helix-turn-helix domain-containing protein [Gammaproteobacteria bacterium]MDH5652207.1 helix-turn-helix domain-containing protein [Gammaproteobacteria bacterium]
MDFYSLSDKRIAAELGERLRSLRLRRDLTQQQLAEATTLSLNVIKALEMGRGKLTSLIAVLRELGCLDDLDSFIPRQEISPLQLARSQGKPRQRASGKRRMADETEPPTEW